MTSPIVHSHPGGDEACALQYGDQFSGITDITFLCPSCSRTCGPCIGASDDRPDLCDDCRASICPTCGVDSRTVTIGSSCECEVAS